MANVEIRINPSLPEELYRNYKSIKNLNRLKEIKLLVDSLIKDSENMPAGGNWDSLNARFHKIVESLLNESFDLGKELSNTIRKPRDQISPEVLQRLLNERIKDFGILSERGKKLERMLRSKDNSGHGTLVISNLLAVASQVKITMIKSEGSKLKLFAANFGGELPGFEKAIEATPQIVSCSFATLVTPDQETTAFNAYEHKVRDSVRKGNILVLFASGNNDDKNKAVVSLEARWDFVLTVGGVYWSKDNQLTASNFAHGYYSERLRRQIPDVCGLVGPIYPEDRKRDAEYIWLPQLPDQDHPKGGWACTSGTSSATPQVAGVCAMIKQVFPAATPQLVKQIIMKSATTVPKNNGVSVQNQPPPIATGAGLVNIDLAIETARILAAALVNEVEKKGLMDVEAAVRRARNRLGTSKES